jgi:hypothetical protein
LSSVDAGIQGYAQQPDAVLSQANPVSTTLYTVLPATSNVRINSIIVNVTWTVQPNPLDVVVTIDGKTLRFYKSNPVSGTDYYTVVSCHSDDNNQDLDTSLTNNALMIPFFIEGRSVKIEVRTTGGTTSNISARVKWAKR